MKNVGDATEEQIKEDDVKGYKAFDKDMKCQGFQFQEGKEYVHTGKIEFCKSGFHFCENPLDTLNYYDLCDSKFAEVEATGKVKQGDNEDSKSVTNEIKINAKLSLPGFI